MYILIPLLLFTLVSTSSIACDISTRHLDDYWIQKDFQEKRDFLDDLTCGSSEKYFPRVVEPKVLRIVIDAIDNQIDEESINRVIVQFSCLYGVREKTEYKRVENLIGTDYFQSICNTELLNNYKVVKSDNGAVLRAGPGTEYQRIGVLKNGSRVLVFKLVGQWKSGWAYIDSHIGDGFIYLPLLEKY